MKYIGYLVFIMGLAAGIFSFFNDPSDPTSLLFFGFGFTICSPILFLKELELMLFTSCG